MQPVIAYIKLTAASAWMFFFGARGRFKALKRGTALVIPGALPANVCNEVIQRINLVLSQTDNSRVWCDNVGSDCRVLGFEKDIDGLLQWFDVDQLIQDIDDYTGRKTKSWFLMANKVIPKEKNRGSGGGMHRDSAFSNQIKCIWYLNEVDNSNGPFMYLPGSNSDIFQNRSRYPVGKTRFDKLYSEPIEIQGEAGTLIVCDTKCIHGGKPIKMGERYAVTLYTSPDPNDKDRRIVSISDA